MSIAPVEPQTSGDSPANGSATPSRFAAPLPPVTQRTFKSGLFDRSDPLEGSGQRLNSFSMAGHYAVERSKQPAVVAALYERACGRLRGNNITGATTQLIDFKDVSVSKEPARRYMLAEDETVRATRMSIFATFRTYGNFLYISVDAFVLPPLNLFGVLRTAFLTLGLLLATTIFLTPVGTLFLTIPWLIWQFRDVVASLKHGDSLGLALRRRYHAFNDAGTFNRDDTLAYFKSALAVLLEGVGEVFEDHGIPTGELQQVMQNINLSTTVSNNGGVMNVLGGIVGGIANAVGGKRG